MQLENTCLAVVELSRTVGAFIKAELGKVQAQSIEHKQRNHLVSYVDKTAEKRLIEGLEPLIENAAFLAEEATVEHTEKDWQWIIDPLDGTTNFLHHIPFFAISIALQYKKKTILGVVYEVNSEECFYSWEGASSSFLNGQAVKVSTTDTLEQSLLATGFPYYDFEHTSAYCVMLQELMLSTRGIRRLGAAALDLAYVACGRFDGYYEYSLAPWDVAAGAFLVQQSGGQVSDFSGGDNYLFGREIVAGNPSIYPLLVDRTQKHFK